MGIPECACTGPLNKKTPCLDPLRFRNAFGDEVRHGGPHFSNASRCRLVSRPIESGPSLYVMGGQRALQRICELLFCFHRCASAARVGRGAYQQSPGFFLWQVFQAFQRSVEVLFHPRDLQVCERIPWRAQFLNLGSHSIALPSTSQPSRKPSLQGVVWSISLQWRRCAGTMRGRAGSSYAYYYSTNLRWLQCFFAF